MIGFEHPEGSNWVKPIDFNKLKNNGKFKETLLYVLESFKLH